MKKLLTFILVFFALPTMLMAQQGPASQNRGLFAFIDNLSSETGTKISWRMRTTDDPYSTRYKLYFVNASTGKSTLIGTYCGVTWTKQSSVTAYTADKGSFSLYVYDKNNKLIDKQEGVKADATAAHDIALNAPAIKDEKADTVLIGYTPGDCSAYDMDGDGEQEIIVKWMAEAGTKILSGTRIYTAHAFYDCYKLNGTRLWRIDAGLNSNAGNNAAFFCWDFDLDGKGEMMIKSAPGTKDALGHYCGSAAKSNTGEDLPGYADSTTVYYRGSDGLPTYGVAQVSMNSSGYYMTQKSNSKSYEWVTIFNGETGEELGSCDYWPYFNIQTNWYPGGNDGAGYGRRGCSQKGGVMKIPCKDGVDRPTVCFQRGAYTYVYCTDYSWDGKKLTEEWRHSSIAATGATKCSYKEVNGVKTYKNISLYSEGAHPSETADLDGDGYDELMIGAAALDHDGSTLWSTKLGHGDAVAVGDLNPEHPGLECWRITEHATGYASSMHDGATGEQLCGEPYSGDDVNRGLCIDIDSTHVGTEYVHNASEYFYDCKGNALYKKNFTSNTGYPNYRIFWDGDLCEEHFSGTCVSKFSVSDGVASNSRISCPGSKTNMLWKYWPVSSINGTKDNPCLQCDLYGDWREELVMFTADVSSSTAKSADGTTDYILRTLTTSFSTDKKLPWLRDDNTYSKEIACQNIGYSQPPHLGYNPIEYDRTLRKNAPVFRFSPKEDALYYVISEHATKGMQYLNGSVSSTKIVNTATEATVQFEHSDKDSVFYIKSGDSYLADTGTSGFMMVTSKEEATPYLAIPSGNGVAFASTAAASAKYFTSTALSANVSRTATSTSKIYFIVLSKDGGSAVLQCPKGDVNMDENVDINDVNSVITVICGDTISGNADVNNDGKVDINDVNNVISIICGEQ